MTPEIIPTAETVFTKEYWGPAAALPPRETSVPYMVSKLDVDELYGQAASHIFAGNPGEELPSNALLDGSADNEFTTPGTVLLVDCEKLGNSDHDREKPCTTKSDTLHWKSESMERDDVMMPAPLLFRRNSRYSRLLGTTEVYNYRKKLCNPDLGLHYTRTINLLAITPARRGVTVQVGAVWKPAGPMEISGMCTFADIFRNMNFRLPQTVGETYHSTGRGENLYRIRSAELCVRGTYERARAKKRIALPRFAGRLTTAPQLG